MSYRKYYVLLYPGPEGHLYSEVDMILVQKRKKKVRRVFLEWAIYGTYEGGSIIPCNHLFSLHMGAFIQMWQCLHQV